MGWVLPFIAGLIVGASIGAAIMGLFTGGEPDENYTDWDY